MSLEHRPGLFLHYSRALRLEAPLSTALYQQGQLEQDVFKLSEQLQLAGQERAQLGHDIMTVKSSMEDGDVKLHDRLDGLQPALNDLEALKADLGVRYLLAFNLRGALCVESWVLYVLSQYTWPSWCSICPILLVLKGMRTELEASMGET